MDFVRLGTEPSTAPDFIKIDFEGYELPVLLAASHWFGPKSTPPIIMIEVQADHDKIVAWLHERGYTLFDIEDRELSALPNTTLNLFALHREKHPAALLRWQSRWTR